jgi:hypothetical protein
MGYYNKMATLDWTWDPVVPVAPPQVGDATFGNCIVSDYTGQYIVSGFRIHDAEGPLETDYPGVFRSENGGGTWTSSPIIDTADHPGTVIGLATSNTMNSLYAILSGTTTVYRSTDYGATWTEFNLGSTLVQNPTSIALSDNGVLVFGYNGGVEAWSSTDGLNSATGLSSGSNVTSVAINASGTVIIAVLVGSVAGNGIYKSTYLKGAANGPSFSRITTSPVNPNDILWTSVACTLGRSEFVACYSGTEGNEGIGGVLYSSDDGDNWTALTTAQAGYRYVAISPFSEGIAAVAGASGLYYGLTTDGTAPTTLARDPASLTTFSGSELTAVLIKTNATNIGPTGAALNRPFVVGSSGDGINLYQATYTYNEAQGPEADPTGPITPLSWTWAPASFPGITGKFVSSIMSDTTGQNIFAGYALDDGSGVYPAVVRSVNGGTGWTGPGVSGSILGSGNYAENAITNIGLAMSTDMSKMYAIVSGDGEIYFSANQGRGWTGFASLNQGTYQQPPNRPQAIACNGDGSEIVIIASSNSGIVDSDMVYYKRRGSSSWYPDVGAGVGGTGYIDPPPVFSSIAIGATGGRVVATISSSGNTGGVYTVDITDAEPSLTFIDAPFNNHLLGWTSVSSAFGNTGGGFVACNGGLGTAGGTGTVFYSELGRSEWTRVYVGYTGAAPAGLFFYATISPDLTGIAVVDPVNSLVYYGKTGEAGMVPSFLTCDETTPALTTQVLLKNGTVETVNVDLPYVAGRGYFSEQQPGVTGPLYVSSYESPPPPVICFKDGSLILCSVDGKDTYLPVESIVPGTLVKTYKHGDKKVVYIGSSKAYNPGNGKKSLANLAKCTPAKYPELTSDLVLTGAHAILVGDLSEKEREDTLELMGKIYITDDKYRLLVCLDDRAEAYEHEGLFSIWHFALENEHYTRNYGVYANGLLVETASLRTMKEFSGMDLL